MLQRAWIVAAGGLAALFVPAVVHGHLSVVDSRQYYNSGAYQDESYPNYEWWPGAYNAGGRVVVRERAERLTDPEILAEYGDGYYPLRWVYDKGEMAPNGNYLEPQGISVRHGVCGDPQTIPEDRRKNGNKLGKDNVYSTPNKDWPILQEFTQGQVMEIRTVMTAYHWGHLEFFLCDTKDLEDPDGVVTQECFNKYPLTRAPGDGVDRGNSPIDPNHPGRYYADPPCRENETEQYEEEEYWRAGGGYVMTMNYQLPVDLTCERCVLQMWYFTGDHCYHPGYEEFNPPSWGSECAPNKKDWIDLTLEYCGDKKWNPPEEFWACSDISIKADGSTSPTTPTPSPDAPNDGTPAPAAETVEPTAANTEPTAATTSAPAMAPSTPAPVAEDVKAEYLGCLHDNQDDRVLEGMFDSPDMSTKMCFDYCTKLGSAFMATQYGYVCWCSPDGSLDYNRHYGTTGAEAVCDMPCMGDETETCGGLTSFDFYKLAPLSSEAGCSTPVEAYEQCGGEDWTGPACCADGYECLDVSRVGCYSQCRPVSTEGGTPSPASSEETTPSPAVEETVAPTPEFETPAPTAAPDADPTRDPTHPTDDCMAVIIEAEDLPVTGDWKVVNDPDASGGKYITWEGLSEGRNNGSADDGDIISTTIDITTPGTYSFKWLMRQPSGVESDKGNDSWLYFSDATRFGPKDTNGSYGTFIKVFGNAANGEFVFAGTADVDHTKTQIAVEFAQAGQYTIEIAGRSHGHQIDQIILFGESLSVDDAAAGCE